MLASKDSSNRWTPGNVVFWATLVLFGYNLSVTFLPSQQRYADICIKGTDGKTEIVARWDGYRWWLPTKEGK